MCHTQTAFWCRMAKQPKSLLVYMTNMVSRVLAAGLCILCLRVNIVWMVGDGVGREYRDVCDDSHLSGVLVQDCCDTGCMTWTAGAPGARNSQKSLRTALALQLALPDLAFGWQVIWHYCPKRVLGRGAALHSACLQLHRCNGIHRSLEPDSCSHTVATTFTCRGGKS